MTIATFLGAAGVALLAVWAAGQDVRSREIPDVVSIGIAVIALAVHSMTGFEPLLLDASIGAAVFIVGFICWSQGWFGGGDVKLLSALAFYFGRSGGVRFLYMLSFASILVALATLAWRWRWRLGSSARRDDPIDHTMAYAVPIAVATIAAIIWNRLAGAL